ncbi:MAG: PIN domain-containing protein [bacterium]
MDGFVSGLTVLTVGQEAASVFGQVKADLRRKGMLIEDLDLLIAATAKAHNLTLVTNNKAHFSRIAGLRLENWLES